MLTREDIVLLEQPLPLKAHEARAKGKSKDGKKEQWLIYVTQEGIIPRLNEVDPSWEWEVRETRRWDKYVAVTGKMTLKEVSRDSTGGNSTNSKDALTDEDTEKGGETDALKRAAMRFGVGLYLRGVSPIWIAVDESRKPWETEKLVLAEFAKRYQHEFGGEQPQRKSDPQPVGQGSGKRPNADGASNEARWSDDPKQWKAFLKSAGEKLALGEKTVADVLTDFEALGLGDWTTSRGWALAALIAYRWEYNAEAIDNYTAALPGDSDANSKLDDMARAVVNAQEARGEAGVL